ncbi:MAG: hypothetical protein A2X89_00460 [Deltaproteobacteria bacterium GWD2_55_8]|nr:MAG: hypothetical protein A2X89_00460 [Deltaproteobacteria bacterium GWD2_55_8]
MLGLVNLPVIAHNPVVDRVPEHIVAVGHGQGLMKFTPAKPGPVYHVADFKDGVIPSSVKLKGFFNDRGALFINVYRVGGQIVYVAHRRP